MIKTLTLLLIAIVFSFKAFAQRKDSTENGMKTYYLVFLKKGANRSQDSITAEMIQEGHMAHLNKMGAEGKLSLAGPFMEDGDIRGICVYNVTSFEEATKLAEEDPAAISGRLSIEVHPWFALKGSCLK